MSDAPVLVAGAGIAGLALAGALHRDGHRVLVLEERPALGSSGGGITLWPRALAALEQLGVADAVRAAGHVVGPGTIRDPAGRLLRRLDQARLEQVLGGPLLAIRRGTLIELLAERLPGDAIRTGLTVGGFGHTPAGVAATTREGLVQGSALVGADGFRSRVARQLSPLRERYAGSPAWRGVAPVGGFEPGEIWGRHQEFGMVPLGSRETYWFATVRAPAGGTAVDPAALLEAFAGWPEEVAALVRATPADRISRVDLLDRSVPRRWSQRRVTLVGDAAHAMRPNLGQGGCQALVDAAWLSSRYRAEDPAGAFAAYERARRRPALRARRLSRQAARVVDGPVLLHRASALVPDAVLLRRLRPVAGR